jgi:nucleoside-diphosphate-sugar epimerase
VARRLTALGYRLRAVVRQRGVAEELRSASVEEIEGDFVSREVTARAAEGADLVVHCAAAAPPDLETARRINLEIIPREEVPPGAYWTGRIDAGRVRRDLGYGSHRTYAEGMAEGERYWRSRPGEASAPAA